jgi:hypothetical protein
MNTGQSILTIAAMLLLSVLVLRVNTNLFYTGTAVSSSKIGLTAISIAQSRLEEIKSKWFDDATDGVATTNINLLTSPSSLGPEAGETYPAGYNDIDDFNGFTKTDSVLIDPTLSSTKGNQNYFNEYCSVVYVSPNNPDVTSGTRTWCKKITVLVAHKLTKDTVKVSTIFSYWVFH